MRSCKKKRKGKGKQSIRPCKLLWHSVQKSSIANVLAKLGYYVNSFLLLGAHRLRCLFSFPLHFFIPEDQGIPHSSGCQISVEVDLDQCTRLRSLVPVRLCTYPSHPSKQNPRDHITPCSAQRQLSAKQRLGNTHQVPSARIPLFGFFNP